MSDQKSSDNPSGETPADLTESTTGGASETPADHEVTICDGDDEDSTGAKISIIVKTAKEKESVAVGEKSTVREVNIEIDMWHVMQC